MYQSLINQYESTPLFPGFKSDSTKPLILELFDSGQGEKVLQLLYSVNLEVKETFSKTKFKIIQKRGKK